MKKTSFIGQTVVELKKSLTEKRTALRDFRFGSAGSKIKNVKDGKKNKKDIARILTELQKHK
jgi:ribosomal protein L29